MNWEHETVLVTGAGGFIGSHLTEHLVALGARTRALVRYNSASSCGWLDHSLMKYDMDIVFGDIRDQDSLRQATKGVDFIFHLAALVSIPYSYCSPSSYVNTNVIGTLNILQLAMEANARLVLHTSTSEVYGTACHVPIDENHPLQGQSPYSASKIGADKLAEAFHLSFGLPVAVLRPFNTYGPRQSARAVIPTIISQALTQPAIRLGSLHPTRDLNYVKDTVQGYIRTAECSDAIGKVTNIGSGKEISIGELARLILEIIGRDIPIVSDEQRIRPVGSEVSRLCADNTHARTMLNWNPRFELTDGLTETIDWIGENIQNYRPEAYAI